MNARQTLQTMMLIGASMVGAGCKDSRPTDVGHVPPAPGDVAEADEKITFLYGSYLASTEATDPAAAVKIEQPNSSQIADSFANVDWTHSDVRPNFQIHRSGNTPQSLILRRSPDAEGIVQVQLTGIFGNKRVHAEKAGGSPIENPERLFEAFLNETEMSSLIEWDEYKLYDR